MSEQKGMVPVAPAAQPPALAAPFDMMELERTVEKIRQLQEKVMVPGVHYGIVPGTDKPTLLQPGAQTLCLTFGISFLPIPEVIELPGGHREVRMKGEFYSRESGKWIGTAYAVCSTMETRYRFRKAPDAVEDTGKYVPGQYWDLRKGAPAKAQELLGGEGFGAKKIKGVWKIVKYNETEERIENPNIADEYNTVMKIAEKRCLVAGALRLTAASDVFTQDLEDMEEFAGRMGAHPEIATTTASLTTDSEGGKTESEKTGTDPEQTATDPEGSGENRNKSGNEGGTRTEGSGKKTEAAPKGPAPVSKRGWTKKQKEIMQEIAGTVAEFRDTVDDVDRHKLRQQVHEVEGSAYKPLEDIHKLWRNTLLPLLRDIRQLKPDLTPEEQEKVEVDITGCEYDPEWLVKIRSRWLDVVAKRKGEPTVEDDGAQHAQDAAGEAVDDSEPDIF